MSDKTHPDHYRVGTPMECRLVLEAYGWDRDHCLASAFEYMCRAGHKPGETMADDLRKAVWNLQRRIAQLDAAGTIVETPRKNVAHYRWHFICASPWIEGRPEDGSATPMNVPQVFVITAEGPRWIVDRRKVGQKVIDDLGLKVLPRATPDPGDTLPYWAHALYDRSRDTWLLRPEFQRWCETYTVGGPAYLAEAFNLSRAGTVGDFGSDHLSVTDPRQPWNTTFAELRTRDEEDRKTNPGG